MRKFYLLLILLCTIIYGVTAYSQSNSVSQMTMTTTASEVELRLAGEGEVVVDWGDGTPSDKSTLSSTTKYWITYAHCYSGSSIHIITIIGETIKHLQCPENQLTGLDVSKNPTLEELNCSNNKLANLDISNNPELWRLSCSYNQLTSLDVRNNRKLENLYCNNNQLTAEALNTLFGTLHSTEVEYFRGKIIFIDGNPGTNTCDRSIAERRGWKFESEL